MKCLRAFGERGWKRGIYLLQHARTFRDLLNNVLVKYSLGQHSKCLMLALNPQLLGLHVDVNIINPAHPTFFLFCGVKDPASKMIVRGIASAFAVLIAIFNDETFLHLAGEILSTSFDGGFRGVDSPDIILGKRTSFDVLGFGADLADEIIITTGFQGKVTVFTVSSIV